MRVPQKPNWTKWDHNQHYHHTPLSSGPQRPRRALDVGCGNGVFARRLAERCDHVVALDRDPDTLEVARRHSADPAVEYLEGDLLTAPLEDHSF
ncbi:MAG TPA: class I SAM-dependent methyltransferase, partial [Acidimicrobiales bacterium]